MDSAASLLEYYARPGVMTGVGAFASLVDELPVTIPGLCQVVQGLLIHPFVTDLYSVTLTAAQRKEVYIRPVEEMLARLLELDNRPLAMARDPKDRLVGNCRDHAVLLCAVLRHQGIPARVRVGFASYLSADLNADHWITEYWHAEQQRWVRVDAQLDAVQRKSYGVTFDPCDLPDDAFFLAGRAWTLVRRGEMKSYRFGHNKKFKGLPIMRTLLVKDLVALNKVEVLPVDEWWELSTRKEEDLDSDERELLDRLAEQTVAADEHFDAIRSAYEDDPRFYAPVESKLRLRSPMTPSTLRSSTEAPQAAPFVPIVSTHSNQSVHRESMSARRSQAVAAFRDRSKGFSADPDKIVIRGAQQHNLKRIDVTIPRNKLVVLTGVSGSGKSSLAFDTLYAEGQRRYVESLSAYVRRYLDQMDKPKVDYIGGLSPAIAIEQKSISKNPRSTVGTVTEVLDYLRVLFSRAGTQHCPQCGRVVEPLSPQQIAGRVSQLPSGTRFQLLAPVARDRKGSHTELLHNSLRDGFSRARIDGEMVDLANLKQRQPLDRAAAHTIELVVDRLVIPEETDRDFSIRLVDSIETALKAGKGTLVVDFEDSEPWILSEQNGCPYCQISLPALTPQMFSFNAPAGMCPECNGLGTSLEVDPNLIVENPELSLMDGASRWYGNIRKKKDSPWHHQTLQTVAEYYGADLETPYKDLSEEFKHVLIYGSGDITFHFKHHAEKDGVSWSHENVDKFNGAAYHIKRLFRQTQSEYTRKWYMSFMSQLPCPACKGTRLCPEARSVTVGGCTLSDITSMTVEQAYTWVTKLFTGENGGALFSDDQFEVMEEVLKELQSRLQFMLNVGLHYLTLDRAAPTLSGGEGQRIRLASQLGCGLVGVLYILDEPSIGLHSRDQSALLETLTRLRDMGNTVLVVEHDAETMLAADYLIDLGPGAGVLGGNLMAAGTPQDVCANPDSLTGQYLSGLKQVTAPNGGLRRQPGGWLSIVGARLFNLKNITAQIPLGVMTCITGVSGSGKSSLIADTLYPALMRKLHNSQMTPGPFDRIEGLEQVDKVINITQEPIGRTPRSNPATYVGVFDEIRKVFAATPEAKMRGYKPDRFSFNVKGGRCEVCKGHGLKQIEMHFLPDVWVTCQECKGTRYNRHTLEITYKGKNIAEVLDMDVQEALGFFANHPAIARILQTLHDVGLDYVKLGQSATTLSGGEAQRVKLASELCRVSTGNTLYILDEPTTGLHFADIQRLLDVLHRLVDAGNTVAVIEHNLDVIKTADWIIDLGPEGGAGGGRIVAEGTPETVARTPGSFTGEFLAKLFAPESV